MGLIGVGVVIGTVYALVQFLIVILPFAVVLSILQKKGKTTTKKS